MAQTILKSIFWAVGILAFSTMVIVGVTDPTVFHHHFYGDTRFDLFSFLGDLWPKSILIVLGCISAMLALGSDWLDNYLGSLKMSGTTFMLLIFLACVIAMVSLIYTSQFSYPVWFEPETAKSTMLRIFSIMAIGCLGFPFLAIMFNDSLASPAPLWLLIGLWLVLFSGFDV